MDIHLREVLANLRSHDFGILGPYEMNQYEAEKLADALEKEFGKKGRWIPVDGAKSLCSSCNVMASIMLDTGKNNYCPNCGADMRERDIRKNGQDGSEQREHG